MQGGNERTQRSGRSYQTITQQAREYGGRQGPQHINKTVGNIRAARETWNEQNTDASNRPFT